MSCLRIIYRGYCQGRFALCRMVLVSVMGVVCELELPAQVKPTTSNDFLLESVGVFKGVLLLASMDLQ